MVFGYAVSLDTTFRRCALDQHFSLSELLAYGLVYVPEAARIQRGKAMRVCVTWPPVFTVAMAERAHSYPSLLDNLAPVDRAMRSPILNEVDDLRTLVCRFRLLSKFAKQVRLDVLLPSLSDPAHGMHDVAKVCILSAKSAYEISQVQLLAHQVETLEPLNVLLSRSVPAAYWNAPLASFADSFFIVELAKPDDPALARLRIRQRRSTRATASATTPTPAAAPSPYLVIFISSKSHVVDTRAENVDPEMEKILAGLGGDTDFAWLLLHVTDSPATICSDLNLTHAVPLCAGTTNYELFAGPMMATVRQ